MLSPVPVPLFKAVDYWIADPIAKEARYQAEEDLRKGGAKRATRIADASHVITESSDFFGIHDADINSDAVRVTPVWVKHCVRSGYLISTKYYSPDPNRIMSGIVIHSADLPDNDVEILTATVRALGGQWKASLTKDVTHLITLAPEGSKYSSIMGMKKAGMSDIEVVTPAWLMDCIGLNQIVPTGPYAFPEPEIYRHEANIRTIPTEPQRRSGLAPSGEQLSIFHTALIASGEKIQKNPRKSDIWGERRFILCGDLGASPNVLSTLETSITNNGGIIVRDGADYDVLICRYRSGDTFEDAVSRKLIIATVPWVFHCETMGRLTSPLEEFLHFPIPRVAVTDFEGQEITITNYTGEAREYIKKLIEAMGGRFSPALSSSSTKVVIAAELYGKKAKSAYDRRIPIVNHLWLEECFLRWKNVPIGGVASQHFSKFPTGLSFADLLGRRRGFLSSSTDYIDPASIRGDVKRSEVTPPQTDSPQQPSDSVRPRSQLVAVLSISQEAKRGLDSNRGSQIGQTGTLSPRATSALSSSRYNPDIEMAEAAVEDYQSLSANPPALAQASKKAKHSREKRQTPRETSAVAQDGSSDEELNAGYSNMFERDRHIMSSKSSASNPRNSSAAPSATSSHPQQKETRMSATPFAKPPTDPDLSTERRSNIVRPRVSEKLRARPSSPGDTSRTNSLEDDDDSTTQSKVMVEEQSSSGMRPRRGAAARADENLRNIVMPDVLQHERELKASHGDVRKLALKDEAKAQKRTRDDDDAENSVDEHRSSNARRSTGKGRPSDFRPPKKGKTKALTQENGSSDEESDTNGNASGFPEKRNTQKKRHDPKALNSDPVVIMTTKYTMDAKTEQDLKSLGAKMTDDPLKCTYLVTPSMVRTIKFICVLARGQYIVHPDWVRKSVKAKKLLAPSDFQLKDEDKEKLLDCILSDSLRRARDHKLFVGHKFWISTETGLSFKDLKTVVVACGGEVASEPPKSRLLKDKNAHNLHVVSAVDDKVYWEGLAEDGIPIYTKEIIIDSAFKQKVDWKEHLIV